MARDLGEAIVAPLHALGVEPAEVGEAALSNYILAMVAALTPLPGTLR